MIYGSVMGSFCCEKFGVERFRTLTRAEIDARYQEFKSFTTSKSSTAARAPARHGSTRIALLLLAIGVLAAAWHHSHGYLLYYGDAESHLGTARRIVDSRTPGTTRSAAHGCRCRMC